MAQGCGQYATSISKPLFPQIDTCSPSHQTASNSHLYTQIKVYPILKILRTTFFTDVPNFPPKMNSSINYCSASSLVSEAQRLCPLPDHLL